MIRKYTVVPLKCFRAWNAFGIRIDIYCRHDDNKRYRTKTESTKSINPFICEKRDHSTIYIRVCLCVCMHLRSFVTHERRKIGWMAAHWAKKKHEN